MAQSPDRVQRGDATYIIAGVERMLSGLSRSEGRALGPLDSPLDGKQIYYPLKLVVRESEIPESARFTEAQRRGFEDLGLYVGKVSLDYGINDANKRYKLQYVDPGFEACMEVPRMTEVAFPLLVSELEQPGNRGLSLVEQKRFASRYASRIADIIGELGQLCGVIPLASEFHQGMAGYFEANGHLPAEFSAVGYVRTATREQHGENVVLQMIGDRLIPKRGSSINGVRVDNSQASVIGWPFIIPAGAVV